MHTEQGGLQGAGGGVDYDRWRQTIRNDTFSRYHHSMGMALEKEGNPTAAAAAYRRAIEQKPDFWPAYIRLLTLLESSGQAADAAVLRQTAASLEPQFEARGSEAIAIELIEADEDDEADRWLDHAARAHLPLSQHYLGFRRLSQGQIAEARELWHDAAPITPIEKEIVADTFLKKIRHHPADWPADRAVIGLTQVTRLAPFSASAHVWLAEAFSRLDRIEEGKAVIRRALALEPDLFIAHAILGSLNLFDLQLEQSVTALSRCLAMDPVMTKPGLSQLPAGWVRQQLAMAFVASGRLRDGERVAREGLNFDRLDPALSYTLVLALLGQDRLDECEAVVRQALSANLPPPYRAHLLSDEGLVLHRRGRLADAEAAHRRALDACPEFPWALTNLALSLWEQGRRDEAQAIQERTRSYARHRYDLHQRARPAWARIIIDAAFPNG